MILCNFVLSTPLIEEHENKTLASKHDELEVDGLHTSEVMDGNSCNSPPVAICLTSKANWQLCPKSHIWFYAHPHL